MEAIGVVDLFDGGADAGAGVGGQMRFDLRKLRVRQPELIPDASALAFGSRDSSPAAHANALIGPGPSRLLKMRTPSTFRFRSVHGAMALRPVNTRLLQ